MYSCLYAAHQRNRAVILLVAKEERTVHKPVNKVIALVLLYSPVLSYKDVQMICGNVTVTVAPIPGAELSETFPP